MGSLVLLRHAKSSWEEDLADLDRPLAPRGIRDAAAAGDALRARRIAPDLVLCSTARRTRLTWTGLRLTTLSLHFDGRIYGAAGGHLLRLIRQVPDQVNTLLLIGHAPGVPDLADALASSDSEASAAWRLRRKYPTAGLAIFETARSWASLTEARLLECLTPREHYGLHQPMPR
jgi:phosphohistidine phosphatase